MALNADIIVYARDRRLALAVEITSLSEPIQDVIATRRHLVMHPLFPRASFFLLVNPSSMFLWREETLSIAPPDYEVSADAVVNYLLGQESRKWEMTQGELEIIVLHWLGTIVNGLREADPASPPEQMLIESGLYELIRNGDLQFDTES